MFDLRTSWFWSEAPSGIPAMAGYSRSPLAPCTLRYVGEPTPPPEESVVPPTPPQPPTIPVGAADEKAGNPASWKLRKTTMPERLKDALLRIHEGTTTQELPKPDEAGR